MNIKYIFVLLTSLVMIAFGMPKHLQKRVDKVVKTTFNTEEFTLNPVVFPLEIVNQLPAKFDENNLFEIMDNDNILGYAYVAKAKSKADDFDYLILFDSDLIIIKSKVLIYREDYGGEIGSKRWLKQFKGKTYTDNLKYGENIAAISGATISVRSMTNAVNNVLASIKILHEKELL